MHVRALFIKCNIAAALVAMLVFKAAGQTCDVKISFHHIVGDEQLRLDSKEYKNALGQKFSVRMFKYYVGNFHLTRSDGKEFISSEYFFINEDEPSSKTIVLHKVPKGVYTSVSFILGVDSIHNCSGAQEGALDPANGMFWAWNTGYIFLKLEGISNLSQSPGHILEYHIGGFKQKENNIRTISLKLDQLKVSEKTQLEVRADVLKIVSGKNEIDFSKTSSVTDAAHGKIISDNYSYMFSLQP